jgi:hypothetical protein
MSYYMNEFRWEKGCCKGVPWKDEEGVNQSRCT